MFLQRMTVLFLSVFCMVGSSFGAIALDRTRVIFNGDRESVTLNVNNQNKQLPYLAQGWVEDKDGNKIQEPFIVLPPVQRIEADRKSQIKVQALPSVASLPQDRESVFYFNLREIPPKSDKPNTLQIALQTRIKLFYRPASILVDNGKEPWQNQVVLEKTSTGIRVINPTPYHITIVEVTNSKAGAPIKEIPSVMVAPKTTENIKARKGISGSSPTFTYVNDYGGRTQVALSCKGNRCTAVAN